jgi:peroxiredoxin
MKDRQASYVFWYHIDMAKRALFVPWLAVAIVVLALAVPAGRASLRQIAYDLGFRRPAAPVHVGERLPALALADLSGAQVTLGADFPRGVVVYNVFASWCPPCNAELPDIKRAAVSLSRSGVRFVGIDQGESATQVGAFAARHDLRYPMLLDSSGKTTSALGARVIPETLIVRDGIVKSIIVGPTTASALSHAVEDV